MPKRGRNASSCVARANAKKKKDNQRYVQMRQDETQEEHESALQARRAQDQLHRLNESEQKRTERLEQLRQSASERRGWEQEEERHSRLDHEKQNKRIRRDNESEAERIARLGHLRSNEKERRDNESEAERIARLEHQRLNVRERRENETEAERIARLGHLRLNERERRENDIEAERIARLEHQRLDVRERRENETEAERIARLGHLRLNERERRENEIEAERKARLEHQRLDVRERRENETEAERIARLGHLRLNERERRENEIEAERIARLEHQRLDVRERRENETEAERIARLGHLRLNERERRDNETEAERIARLGHLRLNERERRDNESEAERIARLGHLRLNERERRDNESEAERIARLGHLRLNERERRDNESEAERIARLEHQRLNVRERRENEIEAERIARLEHLRLNVRERRGNESAAERIARVEYQSLYVTERRNQETNDETVVRLGNMRQNEGRRRAHETNDVRNERLTNRRQNERDIRNRPVVSANVGGMTDECRHCHALRFPGETTAFCCSQGKVKLDPLQEPPEEMKQLFVGDSVLAKEFRKNLRQYNCLFQFTSFGAKEIRPFTTGWNPSIVIQGQIHHFIGSLIPDPEEQAKYLQIYFLDPQDSIRLRLGILNDVTIQREIVTTIEYVLRGINPYIDSFKMAMEMLRSLPEGKIIIDPERRPNREHERRYNCQIANEVAVILPDNHEPFSTQRHVILKERGGGLHIISECHRSYDTFQYILFFPRGEDGWHQQIKMTNDKKMTPMKFYSYQIMHRINLWNPVLYGCRLFQQYLVDSAAKIESERLSYIRNNQTSLRSTTYKGLTDALNDNDNLENVGRRILLSSTFVGGPRYMMERCQDALMYVRKYGNASLFITMTCNPNWTEIKENLFEGQQPCDRPDLVSRVFDLKRKMFIKHVTGMNGYFGNCIAFVLSVEYQKRGLPHLHCLLWLDAATKPCPNNYDDVVQADIPDPHEFPELHTLVLKHMIHGPFCHPNSACWKNGKCSKGFPKKCIEYTQTGEDSYPLYRRRSPDMGGFTGHQERRNDTTISSEWVVPYNSHLLQMFNCHINVEICTSVKSIKYVIKYSLKGSDQAVFGVSQDDEITQFLSGRYIGPSEAVAKILGFPVHEREPAVLRLQVHLPQEQQVIIRPNPTTAQVNDVGNGRTSLTAFFELCTHDAFAKSLLYCDVPRYYTWTNKSWERRKRGLKSRDDEAIFESNVLGRVYTVSPKTGELYYLRLLLHHVPGPGSFDVLKTHGDDILPSFKEACRRRGLLQDDNHWITTMEDAERTQFPKAMRDLFVVLLINEEIGDPLELWNRFKGALSEDFYRAAQAEGIIDVQQLPFDQALHYIQDKLVWHNKSLNDFSLPSPNTEIRTAVNVEIARELAYNHNEQQAIVQEREPVLTNEQRIIYDHVCTCYENGTPAMIFLDAPGGTGKTFLTNIFLAKVRGNMDVALAVASSGIAATLMSGGRTAHSRFKIPLNVTEDSICSVDKNSHTAELMRATKVIVWDECPMMRRESFEAVDRMLRDVRNSHQPFGGILTICCGDFRQLLPVVKRGGEADVVNSCIKRSFLWRAFRTFHLTKNMRLADHELDYARFLLAVGEDRVPKNADNEISLPREMEIQSTSMEDCIEHTYPSFSDPKEIFSGTSILVPHNDTMRDINGMCIHRFPGTVKQYRSFNTVSHDANATHFPTEFLDSIELSGLPPHNLELKVGSPIILMRNLSPPKLCNGTRLIVQQLHDNLIVAEIITGAYQGDVVMIPRITIDLSECDNVPLRRSQFPIQSCFAMTIHKAQGQTLEKVMVYLDKPVFQHGQLYVALSRGRSKDQVRVFLKGSTSTRNVVYKQILSGHSV